MKKVLGLDLGTNSIGWALIDKEESIILGMGSRIIPMGSDKIDYEKGVGITKNADRRIARTIRKMNKRYKQRRNKLLYILHTLEMLPEQFQFRHKIRNEDGKLTNQYRDGFPESKHLQDLELLPIKKKTLQLDSVEQYQLRVRALGLAKDDMPLTAQELGKILYQFNQLRGYSGGNKEEDTKKKKETDDETQENSQSKKYEVIIQKVSIVSIEKSDRTFKVKGGKNKGEELPFYNVTVILDNEEKEGISMLQNLEAGKDEELEIRIKQTKSGENILFTLPQKTNWRKNMEEDEKTLKENNWTIGQYRLNDLQKSSEGKWKKIRNRVFLRNQYQREFDLIWAEQTKHNNILNNCPKEILEKIALYLFPGNGKTVNSKQDILRNEAIEGGLNHIIRNQIIYYQRKLKPQTELISNCQFEKGEKVLAITHPLFQEFRCWDQINRLYLTSKEKTYNERKKKEEYKYTDRYLTSMQKQAIYIKLQNQKQVGFSEVAKIVGLKNDKTDYLNGLNVKAKLKGQDTFISVRKVLNDTLGEDICKDVFRLNSDIVEKIWAALFDANNTGSEYDVSSPKIASLTAILKNIIPSDKIEETALRLAQNISYTRKYSSLSKKAVNTILPLMQCNPSEISDVIKDRFKKITNVLETGEIKDEDGIESYMIEYIFNNPDILATGGMMYAFASSIVYGKHTAEHIKPTIANYHEIKYNPDRKLRNPVVEQIANETMQVIKAIWKQYILNPNELEIRIELARDLKNSAAEREKIYKGQLSNQKINESAKKRLIELKQTPSTGNIDLYKLWSKQSLEDYPKQSKEPTLEEIQKLRIWEEQKCISPYTLKPIPLSKLFSPDRLYDIDHIIPKSRFFDDSLSNKIVCETNINEEKDNRTAWEYISQQNSRLGICSVEDYIKHINDIFYGKKKKNLLSEKIPNNVVERQIKDTQYISIAVKNEIAKIVGSDNIKSTTGEVTAFLRGQWGLKKLLMRLTEERFKQMELWSWNKDNNKPDIEWVTKYYDKEKEKHIYEIKNWSKRYDHRHHAIDALVVALTEQSHIQRLNNLNKGLQDWIRTHKDEIKLEIKEGETELEAFFNLEEERRKEIQKGIEGFRKFDSPFTDLIKQTENQLNMVIVSHKPKDKLSIQINEKTQKKELRIKGALHEATFYGKLNEQDTKTVNISNLSAKDIEKIIDPVIAYEIRNHKKKYDSMKEAFSGEGLKSFNENRFQRKTPRELKPPVYKVKIRYNTKEDAKSSLQRLYDNNEKLSVKTGDNYLFLVMEKTNKKREKERVFDIVSLYDAAQIAKDEWNLQNENFKQKICEDYRIKHKEKPDKVLFYLQQNDLVYLPEKSDDPISKFDAKQFNEWIKEKEHKIKFNKRVYKVVDTTQGNCFFIPHNYANTISASKNLTDEEIENLKKIRGDVKLKKYDLNFVEFGTFGSSTKTEVNEHFVRELINDKKDYTGEKPLKIQDSCIKIRIDWLGNPKLVL